jgi:hypothetical protein
VSVPSFFGAADVAVGLPDEIVVVVTTVLLAFGDFVVVGVAELVGDFTVAEGDLIVVDTAAAGIDSDEGDVVGTETAGLRGTFEGFRSPAPSWPHVFSPQHMTAPLAEAQVCFWPAETADTPVDSPTTSTGMFSLVHAPWPTWPEVPSPQQVNAPALVTAHVWYPPAAIDTTGADRPATSTGRFWLSHEALPIWP